MDISVPEPVNRLIMKHTSGTVETLSLNDDGEILHNDKPLITMEDHNKAMAILLRGICSMVR